MPALDFANPLHTFSSNLTYTATKDCYLFGGFNNDVGRTVKINNTPIICPTSSGADHRVIFPCTNYRLGML